MADALQPVSLDQIAPAWWQARWLQLVVKVSDPLSIAVLFGFWLWSSWLRWGDPLIDFPRILYASWRLSQGDLLYRDVVGQYGPLAYLAGAAGFKIFGPGLDVIIGMNIAIAIVAVLLLRGIFFALGSRLMAWLASVVFICVFAFGDYILVSNYNFITPYSAQATWGFVGLLLVVWGLLKCHVTKDHRWLAVAGLGLAVAYLNKPDLWLAALGAVAVFASVGLVRRLKHPRPTGRFVRPRYAFLWFAGGFISLWLPVFFYFVAAGGWAHGFYAANHLLFTLTNARVLVNVGKSPLMDQFFGFDDPWVNFREELDSGLVMLLGCAVILWAGQRCLGGSRKGSSRIMYFGLAIAPLIAAIACQGRDGFWTDSGEAFALPVFLATAICLAGSWRGAWLDQAGLERNLPLAVLGTAASLMLVRMILNVRFFHFGFFMMPLAVCFWLHLMVAEAPRRWMGCFRAYWLIPAVFCAITLLGVVQLSRISLRQYRLKTYDVGSGRDYFFSYPPSIYPNGWLLKTMIEGAPLVAPHARRLAVFPGGVAVNYHLRIRSPLPAMEIFPIAITASASQRALAALALDPPDIVLLYARNLTENGANYFGAGKESGLDILRWLNERYKIAASAGSSPFSFTRHQVDFLIPNAQPGPPPKIIPVELD